jgi:hypothetical protein
MITLWQAVLLYVALQVLWTLLMKAFPGFVEGWLLRGIEHRNTLRVERLKDELARDTQRALEQLKLENNASLDRAVKFQQREFDVLPEAWRLLTDAFTITRPVTLGVAMSPEIHKMTAEQLEYFLDKIPLADWQKNELRAASDPVRYYLDAISWHDLNRAQTACGEFHVYLSKNGIFIPPDVKTKFTELDDLLAAAIGERHAGLRHPNTTQHFEKGLELDRRGPGLLQELEQDVQNRFWNRPAERIRSQT